MIKKILVPTDGSPQSQRAFSMALYMGSQFNAEIILLNVVSIPEALGYNLSIDSATVQDMHNISRDTVLAATTAGTNVEGVQLTAKQISGHPEKEISRESIEEDIDLIIMGVHGYGPITGSLMGSVSQKVLAKATIPVLLIK